MNTIFCRSALLAATLVSAFLCAQPARAQQFDFEAYLRRAWSNPARLTVQKFMARAELDGHLRTARQRSQAKRAWGNVVLGGRRIRLSQLALPAPIHIGPQPNAAVVLDREYNGTVGFADDASVLSSGGLQIDGNVSANGNTDCFRFSTLQDGVVQLQLLGRGTKPIPYGDFAIYNAKGYVTRVAEGSTSRPASTKLELPRGQYYVIVEAPSASSVTRKSIVEPIWFVPPASLKMSSITRNSSPPPMS